MTTTSGGPATTPSVVTSRAWGMLALATLGFARELLGLGADQPAGTRLPGRPRADLFPAGVASRGAGGRRLARAASRSARSPTGSARGSCSPPSAGLTIVAGALRRLSRRLLLELLIGGFFLGLGGTTFAVGVPFVSAWFPPERRGLALGIFGVGMGGTAISAFTTVQLADALRAAVPVPARRRRPGRLRRRSRRSAAGRPRPLRRPRLRAQPHLVDAADPRHPAGVVPVRRRLRRLRRVQRLPADLPARTRTG